MTGFGSHTNLFGNKVGIVDYDGELLRRLVDMSLVRLENWIGNENGTDQMD